MRGDGEVEVESWPLIQAGTDTTGNSSYKPMHLHNTLSGATFLRPANSFSMDVLSDAVICGCTPQTDETPFSVHWSPNYKIPAFQVRWLTDASLFCSLALFSSVMPLAALLTPTPKE